MHLLLARDYVYCISQPTMDIPQRLCPCLHRSASRRSSDLFKLRSVRWKTFVQPSRPMVPLKIPPCTAMSTQPCPLSHAHSATPTQPCTLGHAHSAMHTQPCPLSHAHSAMPTQPCPLGHAHPATTAQP